MLLARITLWAMWGIVVTSWMSTSVWAQQVPADTPPCPSVGESSPSDVEAAQRLIEEGYELNTKILFEEAAVKFAQALTHVESASVRLALAVALYNSAQLLPAYEQFGLVVRCGKEELSIRLYRSAVEKHKILKTRLARVEVQSLKSDADVWLNGERWTSNGNRRSKAVYPGYYVVRVERPEYLEQRFEFSISPGQKAILIPKLMSVRDGVTVERRLRWWMPWAVVGAGTGLGLLGAGLQWKAMRDMDSFDTQWAEQCGPDDMNSPGCRDEDKPELLALHTRARWESGFAIGALVIAGTSVLAGFTLSALNRARTRQNEAAKRGEPTFVPLVSPGAVGLSGSVRF